MPKRDRLEEYDRDMNPEKQFQYTDKLLGEYSKFAAQKPRISLNEIKKEMKKFAGRQYEDMDKANYLNYVLRPLTDTLRFGSYAAKEADKLVSLKDAFEAYQDLAKLNESRRNWEDAAKAWGVAGYIAKKAKANQTANKFFQKAGEARDHMPLTGNKNWDRNFYLRTGKAYESMGRLSEKEAQDWEENGDIHNAQTSGLSATEGYERAGNYSSLARVAKKYFGVGSPGNIRGLKKSGKHSELARSYDEAAKNAEAKGYHHWAKRYQINAEKTRAFMKKKSLTDNSSLEERAATTAAITGIFAGIFLFSSGITGNVIGSQSLKASSSIGALLILLGIIAGYLFLKNRKSKKKKL